MTDQALPVVQAPPRRSADEMARVTRMARIFLPHTSRALDGAFERQGMKQEAGSYLRFAHYTTAQAAINILRTKNLYMRNTTAMADFKEVQLGFNLLNNTLTPERTNALYAAFDAISPGVAQEAITNFRNWWAGNNFLNIYVTSVSEHMKDEDIHGRLFDVARVRCQRKRPSRIDLETTVRLLCRRCAEYQL